MEYPKFKVTVNCMTFNQAKYITDAMNGFTMQQTSFPFVCCIVDDASTDGEQDVIRKYVKDNFDFSEGSVAFHKETDYAHITYAQHKTNKNCYFAVLYLKENHYSQRKPKMGYISEWRDMCEYEALCEGDDWWISAEKLQKQYDILENHQELDMCACGTACYNDSTIVRYIQPSKEERVLSTEETILGGGGFLGTNSLMHRTSISQDNFRFWRHMGLDFFLQIHGSLRGGIYFIPDVLSAYRLSADGSWSNAMQSSPKKYFFHIERIIETLNILDEETRHRYHSVIEKKKISNYQSMFLLGLSNHVLFEKMTWLERMKFIYLLFKG